MLTSMQDGVIVDGAVVMSELIDENAPGCPSCLEPMDVVIGSWWCLECQESVALDSL